MIAVQLGCDYSGCSESESVDVHFNDLQSGSQLRHCVPAGWQLLGCDVQGYALARCPVHAISEDA